MTKHHKKMIAPIVVTILLVIYYIIFFGILISIVDEPNIKVLFGIIPLIFVIGTIYMCNQRIQEIKGGEEDDLSKY